MREDDDNDIAESMGSVFIGDIGFKTGVGPRTEPAENLDFKSLRFLLPNESWNNEPYIDY
jgi:hypothetical protein